MTVHLGKISNANGTIKLYCPVRIERGLFILKIKPQYLETDLTSQMKFNPSTTFSLGSQSRITNIGGISSIMAPPNPHSRSRIGLNTSTKFSMNMSLTETSQVIMKGGTNPKNSMPSKLTFSGHGEGYSSGQSQQNQQLNNKKFRANPFKFSQENVTKKMKMNDEEKTSGESVEISLPIIVISSQKISKKDSQSVETESTSKKKVMSSGKKRKKVEIIEIIGSESREKLKKREIKKKFETESPQFPGTSILDGNSVTRTINPEQTKHLQSSTRNLNLFKGRPTSFISLLNDTSMNL